MVDNGRWQSRALEDKIVQGACVMVLNAIYEEDFLGSRTGSDLDEGRSMRWMLWRVAITRRKVNHILDADIRDFFGSVNHDWLIRFLEQLGDALDLVQCPLFRVWVSSFPTISRLVHHADRCLLQRHVSPT